MQPAKPFIYGPSGNVAKLTNIPANVRARQPRGASRASLSLFRSKLVNTQRCWSLVEQHWRPSGAIRCLGLAFGPSWCDKGAVGEPPTVIHSVAPERAEIGRLITNYVTSRVFTRAQ